MSRRPFRACSNRRSAEVIGHAEIGNFVQGSESRDCCRMLCHGRQHPRNALTRVLRDGVVVHEGSIESLKRFKDDVREVAEGFECGIGLERSTISEGAMS